MLELRQERLWTGARTRMRRPAPSRATAVPWCTFMQSRMRTVERIEAQDQSRSFPIFLGDARQTHKGSQLCISTLPITMAQAPHHSRHALLHFFSLDAPKARHMARLSWFQLSSHRVTMIVCCRATLSNPTIYRIDPLHTAKCRP